MTCNVFTKTTILHEARSRTTHNLCTNNCSINIGTGSLHLSSKVRYTSQDLVQLVLQWCNYIAGIVAKIIEWCNRALKIKIILSSTLIWLQGFFRDKNLGPAVYCPYPRRLESLTIFTCHSLFPRHSLCHHAMLLLLPSKQVIVGRSVVWQQKKRVWSRLHMSLQRQHFLSVVFTKVWTSSLLLGRLVLIQLS